MPESPDAGFAPLPKLETWAVARIPGEKLELRYPSELFLLDEDAGGVLLTSQLVATPVEVPDGAVPPAYAFRGRLTVRALGVVDAAKAEKIGPIFPGDKREAFVEVDGRAKKLVLASHAAYMQRLFAHGFNSTVVLIELGPKRTLVARFDTLGEELRPRVEPSSWRPETWQRDLVDQLLATLRAAK